jgi:hypothetical protein
VAVLRGGPFQHEGSLRGNISAVDAPQRDMSKAKRLISSRTAKIFEACLKTPFKRNFQSHLDVIVLH